MNNKNCKSTTSMCGKKTIEIIKLLIITMIKVIMIIMIIIIIIIITNNPLPETRKYWVDVQRGIVSSHWERDPL